MIAIDCLQGKKLALFGLGGSGLATAAALAAGGADVTVWDDRPDAVAHARAQGFAAQDLRDLDWYGVYALVLAPGVPLTHPHPHWSVQLAAAHGVEVIGDIELFVRMRHAFLDRQGLAPDACPFIAVTGTNGKSTTTALIAHLLCSGGYDVQMGGNIGTAILSLEPPAQGRFYVIECSSYQIDLTPSLNPTVGLLLNLTPDHIDRHGSFARYAAVKQRLVAGAATALISLDDAPRRRGYENLSAAGHHVLAMSTAGPVPEGWFADGPTLKKAHAGKVEDVASVAGIASLRGRHNAQNALAALACCAALGIPPATLRTALAAFKGLPHRMEEVRRMGHVQFINDSKATNADAAAPALAAFEHIYWIAGGVAKQGGIASLQQYFPKIKKAYLIGEAAQDFAATIGPAAAVELCATLDRAVRAAARDAAADNTAEAVVLLSPACASFDQFANYSARGDFFRTCVEALQDPWSAVLIAGQ